MHGEVGEGRGERGRGRSRQHLATVVGRGRYVGSYLTFVASFKCFN